MNFKDFFYSKINEDEGINSTSDVAVHGKPLFGDENNEMVEVMCRNCNTKNSVAKNDKGKKLKCAFCGEEN